MKYVCFSTTFRSKIITIYVDWALYEINPRLFKAIFSSFKQQLSNTLTKRYCIICIGEVSYEPKENYSEIVCDVDQENWIHNMITALEEYLIDEANSMVIHGSSLVYSGKTILLLGERMSGKSTLLEHLLCLEKSLYIDDDCVYYVDNKVFGFNLPIRMRQMPKNKEMVICSFLDDEKQIRYLVKAKKSTGIGKGDLLIIFPEYNTQHNRIRKVSGSELFILLLRNVRHASDNKTRLKNITQLVKNVSAYSIQYTDVYIIDEFLQTHEGGVLCEREL